MGDRRGGYEPDGEDRTVGLAADWSRDRRSEASVNPLCRDEQLRTGYAGLPVGHIRAAGWLSTREDSQCLHENESLPADVDATVPEEGLKLKNETPIGHMVGVLDQ
jgi:hypothetical protein